MNHGLSGAVRSMEGLATLTAIIGFLIGPIVRVPQNRYAQAQPEQCTEAEPTGSRTLRCRFTGVAVYSRPRATARGR